MPLAVAGQDHSALALPLSSELGPISNSPSSLPLNRDVPEHGALPLPGSGELGYLGTQPHGALPVPDETMQRKPIMTRSLMPSSRELGRFKSDSTCSKPGPCNLRDTLAVPKGTRLKLCKCCRDTNVCVRLSATLTTNQYSHVPSHSSTFHRHDTHKGQRSLCLHLVNCDRQLHSQLAAQEGALATRTVREAMVVMAGNLLIITMVFSVVLMRGSHAMNTVVSTAVIVAKATP